MYYLIISKISFWITIKVLRKHKLIVRFLFWSKRRRKEARRASGATTEQTRSVATHQAHRGECTGGQLEHIRNRQAARHKQTGDQATRRASWTLASHKQTASRCCCCCCRSCIQKQRRRREQRSSQNHIDHIFECLQIRRKENKRLPFSFLSVLLYFILSVKFDFWTECSSFFLSDRILFIYPI